MKKKLKKLLITSLVALGIGIPTVAASTYTIVSCGSDDYQPTYVPSLPPDPLDPPKPPVQKELINFESKLKYSNTQRLLIDNSSTDKIFEKIKNDEFKMYDDNGLPIEYELTISLSDEIYVGLTNSNPNYQFNFGDNFYKKIGHPDPEPTTIKVIFYKDKSTNKFVAKSFNKKYGYVNRYGQFCFSISDAPYINFNGHGFSVNLSIRWDDLYYKWYIYPSDDYSYSDIEMEPLCLKGKDAFVDDQPYENKLWFTESDLFNAGYLRYNGYDAFLVKKSANVNNIGSFSIKPLNQ